MTIANPINAKNKIIEIVEKVGSVDPVPSATITNGLKVIDSSGISMDLVTKNTQDDVCTGTMSPQAPVTGVKGGTASIEFNLVSTDQILEPNIATLIRCAKYKMITEQLILLGAESVNAVEGDAVEADDSGAVGVIKVIDGTNVVVLKDTGSADFKDGDELSTDAGVVGTISSSSGKAFYFAPNSKAMNKCSIFESIDGNRKALKECATSFSFSANTGEFIKVSATAIGKKDTTNWGSYAMPSITFPDVKEIALLGNQFLLDGIDVTEFVPVNKSLSFDFGAVNDLRMNAVDDTGIVGGETGDRSSSGGNFTIEAEDFNLFDPHEVSDNDTQMKFSCRLGTGELKRTAYLRSNIVISSVTDSKENNIAGYDIAYKAVGNNDDEAYFVMI